MRPGVIEKIERADAWLYAVAVRSARKGGALPAALGSALSLLRGRSIPGPDVERIATLELLDRLSDRQRQFVIARYYLDLSYRDIAEQFGVSVGTVTSTVSQALKHLRERISADPEELRTWTNR